MLPKYVAPQECPRCSNQFPGGLKRCTACGLEIARALLRPEVAWPWPGFNRGVIECNSCGYSTPDALARRGRIQKCGQCAKVLYIPSGLYRATQPTVYNYKYGYNRSLLWLLTDRIGAGLNRFSRSRSRLPMALILIVMSIGFLFGLNTLTHQVEKIPEKPSELRIYYDKVLTISKAIKNAEIEFDRGASGAPMSGDYTERASPNNKARFVRATERMLKQIEGYLTDIYAMGGTIPQGAESHYAKLKLRLEENQKYYARLKDAIEQKNEGRWKEAFAGLSIKTESEINEEQALNNLQSLVLRPVQPTETP